MTNREIHFAVLFFLIGVILASTTRLLLVSSSHKQVAGVHTVSSCMQTHSLSEVNRLTFGNKTAIDYILKNCKTIEDAHLVDLSLQGLYDVVLVTSCPTCPQKNVSVFSPKKLLYEASYRNPHIAIERTVDRFVKNVITIQDDREKITLAWNPSSSSVQVYDKQTLK